MAIYEYEAKNMDGTILRGRLQASDEDHAYHQLRLLNLYLLDIRELRVKTRTRPLSAKLLADFAKQIAVMLNSGIPLIQAINLLQQREMNISMVSIYRDLYLRLMKGNEFSEALEAQKGIFPSMVINLFRAGEQSGDLSGSAGKLASYYEKDDHMKKKIMGAMAYPIFLLLITLVSLLIIFTVVLPSFFHLFDELEDLPPSTKFLVFVSDSLRSYGFQIFIFFAALICVGLYLSQKPRIRLFLDKMLLHLPTIGPLMRIIVTARFSRTLSSLYSGGIPLIKAIQTASAVINNRYLELQFGRVIEDVCNGISLSAALSTVDGFDHKLTTGIFIGEESGELGTMLDHIADSFDDAADEASKRLTTLIEPAMIVILGIMIGYIMISVMKPIYLYYQTIS